LSSKSRAVAIQNYVPSNAKPPEGSQWEGSYPLEPPQNFRKWAARYFDRVIRFVYTVVAWVCVTKSKTLLHDCTGGAVQTYWQLITFISRLMHSIIQNLEVKINVV